LKNAVFAKTSRRTMLAGGIAAAAASMIGATGAKAMNKASQASVGYKTAVMEGHNCGACKLFEAPASCRFVQGSISPDSLMPNLAEQSRLTSRKSKCRDNNVPALSCLAGAAMAPRVGDPNRLRLKRLRCPGRNSPFSAAPNILRPLTAKRQHPRTKVLSPASRSG
jgi:hypothetical protein